MLNLQVLTSLFSRNHSVVNVTAYMVAAAVGLWLLASLLKIKDGYDRDCLAIAALAMLSLTFLYHRLYDMRLVLLTVPALVLVAERSLRWGAALLTVTFFLLTSTSRITVQLIGSPCA